MYRAAAGMRDPDRRRNRRRNRRRDRRGNPGGGSPAGGSDAHARGGWAASRPELAIAALLVAVLGLGGYAIGGPGVAAAIVIVVAGAALLLLRTVSLPDPGPPETSHPTTSESGASYVDGFWRKRTDVDQATKSLIDFDARLRGPLQHLLAARLAERHSVSLYADPDAARRLLLPDGHGALWFWLDPARPPAGPDDRRPGIRPRTLAALIDRLERL